MSEETYFTVRVNGITKLISKDYKSAYDAYLMQRLLGNDPVMKQGNKILIGKNK